MKRRFPMGWLLGAIALLAIALSRGIFSPYSLWLDELATVHLLRADQGLWTALLHDNFPPLYFYLLKGWAAIFGQSEVVLRLPSLLAVAAALVVLGRYVYRYEDRGVWPFVAVALVGTLPTVAFSAQEVRPYALLLFFSALLTTNALALLQDPAKKDPLFSLPVYVASAILLSLTHYFGLILALLLLGLGVLFMAPRLRVVNGGLILLMMIWPIFHITQGQLLSQAGGNFWIQVPPVIGTLKVFIVTCPFLVLLPLLLPLLWWGPSAAAGSSPPQADRSLAYLLTVFFGFVGLMLLLDLHTPLSIPRYYVAIIPAAALLVVKLAHALLNASLSPWLPRVFLLAILLLILAQGVKAQQRLSLKMAPDQNWKHLAAVVRATGLCRDGCDALGYTQWGNYYFAGLRLTLLDAPPPATSPLKRPLLGFHSSMGAIPAILTAHPSAVCLEPRQSLPSSTFMILPPDAKERLLGRLDLIPCRLS
ncbi:MAG: glycosyltransferase family 39 protein [Cyanobacteriota bacterium]|nr:glycosyltransferase family 39 protein [Cyanobacteriota bacterium]